MAYQIQYPRRDAESRREIRNTSDRLIEQINQTERAALLVHSATNLSALSVARRVREKLQKGLPQSKQSQIDFKFNLDQVAVDGMLDVLNYQSLFLYRSVGSEGAKENGKYGREAAYLKGKHGLNTFAPHYDIVTDALEGTTAASQAKPGAVSVLAGSSPDGILPSQEENHYLEKLFGPKELAGKLSLKKSPEENLRIAQQVLGQNFRVVILNRPRNQEHIQAAQKLGVELVLIEAGDFMPAVLAVVGPQNPGDKHTVVMGSGGFEEGVMSAAAARAVGGLAEARVWFDPETGTPEPPVLTLDQLVPGSAEDTFLSITAITDDPWFGLEKASVLELRGTQHSAPVVDSLVITSQGVKIHRRQPAQALR